MRRWARDIHALGEKTRLLQNRKEAATRKSTSELKAMTMRKQVGRRRTLQGLELGL